MELQAEAGINRNIVECKEEYEGDLPEICHRINRNIVECKVYPHEYYLTSKSVLIETLWNVK